MKKVPNKTHMPYVFIVDLLLTVHKLQGPAAGGNTLLVRQGSGWLRVQQLCRHQEVVRRQRILEQRRRVARALFSPINSVLKQSCQTKINC